MSIDVSDSEAWRRPIILPSEILNRPPSAECGVEWETEVSHRVWGCELLQEAGVLLRFSQVVMCTAQTLLQRFFYRISLTKIDAFSVAMACMLLAMKIEEDRRQPTALVLVFHRMFERRMGVEPSAAMSMEAMRMLRDEMFRVERHVLAGLGFGFYNIMDHPHKFILYYLRVLELNVEGDVSQRAWNYLNDSLRTDLSLRFRSEIIACAAIYMASRSLGIKLPDNPPWWILFNADIKAIGQICNTILALYRRPKIAFLEPLCERSVFRNGGPLRKGAVGKNIPGERVDGSSACLTLPEIDFALTKGEPCQAQEHAETVVEPAGKSTAEASTEPPSKPEAASKPEAESTAVRVTGGGVSGCRDSSDVITIGSGGGCEDRVRSGVGVACTEEAGHEQARKSQSRSPNRRKRRKGHSISHSSSGTERDPGIRVEANRRSYKNDHRDRQKGRKRPRERTRSRDGSRSRSRDRNSRWSNSKREGDCKRVRDQEWDRGRGREWVRNRDQDRDRHRGHGGRDRNRTRDRVDKDRDRGKSRDRVDKYHDRGRSRDRVDKYHDRGRSRDRVDKDRDRGRRHDHRNRDGKRRRDHGDGERNIKKGRW